MPVKLRQKDLIFCEKDQYGALKVDLQQAISSCYRTIKFTVDSPGCHGHCDDLEVFCDDDNFWTLKFPAGKYTSNKHFHSAKTVVLAVESSRCRLNLASRPLFLLKTIKYNGDYRSLTEGYFLFGQNEDCSYFAHRIRPSAAKSGSLDDCRAWMWFCKPGEIVAARQGDLALIAKSGRLSGKITDETQVSLGNHVLLVEAARRTKNRLYVFNPQAVHYEHDSLNLQGWYEPRLAKQWSGTRRSRVGYGD